ncbi:hypothetical protein C4579_04405 [Candidatus Microgenomates bacterium]|nr:MAG: hypothetical protein C4579_04405 [Candidatus Microgenomates bacterium]
MSEAFSAQVVAALGLDKETTSFESERVACAGALIALIKAFNDPKLRNKKIAIISSEPTGNLGHPQHYSDPTHVAIPATFTDLTTVLLIDLSKYDHLQHKIEVVPGGGIDVDILYGESLENSQSYPDGLDIEFNGEGENPLIYNDGGFFMRLRKPPNGMPAVMEGIETTRFFREITGKFIDDFLQNDDLDTILRYVLGYHEPSQAVLKRVNRSLNNNPQYDRKFQLPFTLSEIGTGNGTSATIFMNLLYNILANNPNPDRPIALFAMGIGAVLAGLKMQRVRKTLTA